MKHRGLSTVRTDELRVWRLPVSLAISLALLAVGVRPASGADFAGGEFQVNVHTTGHQSSDLASVAADANGNFIAVWSSFGQDGNLEAIIGRRFASNGAAIGTEFEVNSYTTGTQTSPQVAADADGDFVVVWSSYGQDGDVQGVFGQRFSSSGSAAGTEFQVNTYTTGFQSRIGVAADADGDFVVVWTSPGDGGSFSGVFGQRYDSSGAEAGTEFQINTFTPDEQFGTGVAADAAGNFVVAWSSEYQDGSQQGVFAQRYASDGSTVGAEFQVNSYTTGTQFGRAIGSTSDGRFVIAWVDFTQGIQAAIFARRFDSGGTAIGTEFQVNTYDPNNQYGPAISVQGDGGFVVTWSSTNAQDGSDDGIFGQRFSSTGAAVGSEFQVNAYTTASQTAASVASAPEGDFLVIWTSFGDSLETGQDGSGAGVFGRLFGPRCPASPLAGCVGGFTKKSLLVKDNQKLIAKMIKGPEILQAEFGNPLVSPGSAYRLCIYDNAGSLAGDLEVDAAGASTWRSMGADPPNGKGYSYRDSGAASDGVSQILLKGGVFSGGKSKILVKGTGSNLPDGIAAALSMTSSVTVQLLGSDAPEPRCFAATLSDITKQESDFFRAK